MEYQKNNRTIGELYTFLDDRPIYHNDCKILPVSDPNLIQNYLLEDFFGVEGTFENKVILCRLFDALDCAREFIDDKLINENIIANCYIKFVKFGTINGSECVASNDNLYSSTLISASYNPYTDYLFLHSPDSNYDLQFITKNNLYNVHQVYEEFETSKSMFSEKWCHGDLGWFLEKNDILSVSSNSVPFELFG